MATTQIVITYVITVDEATDLSPVLDAAIETLAALVEDIESYTGLYARADDADVCVSPQ